MGALPHEAESSLVNCDCRREATNRTFEVGLTIEQVPLVTVYNDWKMLKRYTQPRPEGSYEKLLAYARRAPFVRSKSPK